jgi:hypothetical protein
VADVCDGPPVPPVATDVAAEIVATPGEEFPEEMPCDEGDGVYVTVPTIAGDVPEPGMVYVMTTPDEDPEPYPSPERLPAPGDPEEVDGVTVMVRGDGCSPPPDALLDGPLAPDDVEVPTGTVIVAGADGFPVPLPASDPAGPYGETCGPEDGPIDVFEPDTVREEPLPDTLSLPETGTVTEEDPPLPGPGTVIVNGFGDVPALEGPEAAPLG